MTMITTIYMITCICNLFTDIIYLEGGATNNKDLHCLGENVAISFVETVVHYSVQEDLGGHQVAAFG